MKISGKIITRCEICRESGNSGFPLCSHKGKRKYIVEYRINGKRYRETVGYSKTNAERRLAEIIAQVHDGTFFRQKTRLNFYQFSEKWLNEYAKPRVKERTYVTYKGYVENHLKSKLGKLNIAEITQSEIEVLLSELLKNLNPKTVNKILKVLKTMFKYARRWKITNDNPAWDIDSFREEHNEMDHLNPEEIRLLLQHSREPYYSIFLTAIFTGMRKSELLALQWGDIDWNSNTIYVRRSIFWKTRKNLLNDTEKRWCFDSPKTKNSIRAIIMSPRLKETLENHKFNETVRLAQLKTKKYPVNPDDLVFTNSVGNPTDPDQMVKRGFHSALESAKLRQIRFHDLRHSFTALLIDQGENLKFIQSQLGHGSIQTTIDRYGHLMPLKNYSNVGLRIDSKVFVEEASGT